MRADVIVDLQFGSTGKGAVAAYLARTRKYDVAVRAQSIQAGHTIFHKGKPYKMRTIPCGWVDPQIELALAPGCFIDKDLLLEEVRMVSEATGRDVRDRLYLDPRATYIIPEDVKEEELRALEQKVGSTAHGAGASLIRKLWRDRPPTRVCDDDWARENGLKVCDTIFRYVKARGLVEGCQGTMLSVHTSPYYPYTTSRESTACGILSEVGVAPRDVNEVHGVFRTYPIRVGGNSGITGGQELTWEEINRRAGREIEPEMTTVTKRVRRIFEFSDEDFEHAIIVNRPDSYYLTFADYLAPGVYGATRWDELSPEGFRAVDAFVKRLHERFRVNVDWIGTGEQEHHFIKAR